jgi:hypothetical protein
MTDNPIDNLGKASIHRRTVLQGMAGMAAVAMLPATANAAGDKEAPEFAKMVADGKLPKLGDRLPQSPLVVTPMERSAATAAPGAAASAAARTTTVSCAASATWALPAGTSTSPR